jgi:hypothetical protein
MYVFLVQAILAFANFYGAWAIRSSPDMKSNEQSTPRFCWMPYIPEPTARSAVLGVIPGRGY